jgi:hypothetical protein
VLKNQKANVFHRIQSIPTLIHVRRKTIGGSHQAELSAQANHPGIEINASKFSGRTWLAFAGVLA